MLVQNKCNSFIFHLLNVLIVLLSNTYMANMLDVVEVVFMYVKFKKKKL